MIDLFFSYAHEDEDMRNELEVHLSMLKRSGLVRAWHDRRIAAGKDLDHDVSEHLESADVILLLLSPHFLASDYCYETEAKRALELHEQRKAIVIPIILQPCDWLESPFRKLRASPRDGKPVAKFPNVNDAFLQVTQDIREAANSLGKVSEPPLELSGRPSLKTSVGKTATPTSDASPDAKTRIGEYNHQIDREFAAYGLLTFVADFPELMETPDGWRVVRLEVEIDAKRTTHDPQTYCVVSLHWLTPDKPSAEQSSEYRLSAQKAGSLETVSFVATRSPIEKAWVVYSGWGASIEHELVEIKCARVKITYRAI